jgi:hypothetical protein
MPALVIGLTIVICAVAVGFIPVDAQTWEQYRSIFPAGAGAAIGVGCALVAIGLSQR